MTPADADEGPGPGDPGSSWPLDVGPEGFRALAAAATELVAGFEAARESMPTNALEGAGPLLEEARRPPAEGGRPLDDLLGLVARGAGIGIDTGGPGYMAYIPSGGLLSAAVADMVALSLNRYTGIAFAAPVLAQIEAGVTRWACSLFGLPPASEGVLTTGGSLANLAAVVAAREDRLGEDLGRARLYCSAQAHHSVAKAARVAGLPRGAVCVVPVDGLLRLDMDALAAAVESDRAAGRRPFMVVATAGTTNTGAIDPLAAVADLCAAQGLWMHVDAAYGGFFQLTARGRARFTGIERADSITLDPHKGLFLPYGTGCVLVRDAATLRAAHRMEASYLQDVEAGAGVPDFADLSPELSREFRGLRVWLPLHLHGVAAFRDALDEQMDMAVRAHEALSAVPGIEVPWEPELSTVAFRVAPDAAGGDPDVAGSRLLTRINGTRRVFLSSTTIDGRFTLRVSLLVHRTQRARLEEALAIIAREAGEELRTR